MNTSTTTIDQVNAVVELYVEMKYSSGSSFCYGFSCDECNGSVVARDRKKLVRNDASRTLCWGCMADGADLHIEPKRSPEEVAKAGGSC